MDLRKGLSSLSTDPQKILKTVIAIAVALLLMWLLMIARMEPTRPAKADAPVGKERVDSLQEKLERKPNLATPDEGSSGIFADAFITFLVLLVLLGLIWFWSEKKSKQGTGRSYREIGGQILGEGAQMKIVRINDEVWVLGITSGSVNLLHRYPEDEWVEQIPEESPEKSSFYNLFKGQT